MTHTAWRRVRLREERTTWTGTLDSATEARHWLNDRLAGESPEALSLIGQAAAELISNALRHTYSGHKGGQFWVSYRLTPTKITIGVTDEGPLPPVAAAVQVYPFGDDNSMPLAESGRGLLLLEGLGIRYARMPLGENCQVAWAVIVR